MGGVDLKGTYYNFSPGLISFFLRFPVHCVYEGDGGAAASSPGAQQPESETSSLKSKSKPQVAALKIPPQTCTLSAWP